jgi:hypothetical protein
VKTKYLHLAAFTCVECNGPVISGSSATRETEIERETELRQIGAACLSCGKQYTSLPTSRPVRHLAPLEWNSADLIRKKQDPPSKSTLVVKDYIQ